MWTVSAWCTVSIPITSMVALPTLNTPYFALNVNRSPTGNGTAGVRLITGTTATVAAAAVVDEPAGTPVHTVSWASVFPDARRASTMTPEPFRAALMSERDRQAESSCCQGLARDGRCCRSYRAALGTTSRR